MNGYVELIRDRVEDMRREGFGEKDKVQIYMADDVYNRIRERTASTQKPKRRQVQTEPMGTGDPTKAAFGKKPESFMEVEMINVFGCAILQEPRLPDGELIFIDASAFDNYAELGMGILAHPVGIDRLRTKKPDPQSGRGNVSCDNCGEDSSLYIEGDHNDSYCSISCLNEVYAE